MKILVATDFSENASHASAYALRWVQGPGSAVYLLHVISPSNDDETQSVAQSLNEYCERLRTLSPASDIRPLVRIGTTVEEINNTVIEIQPDVIVTGLRGLSKGNRTLFGSNAVSLVRNASCPVLVVPEKAQLRPPRKMTVATDYYDSDLEVLRFLAPAAKVFSSEIAVVHVYNDEDDRESEGFMLEAIARELRKKVDYSEISFKLFHDKSVSHGIQQFSETSDADLVVLSARKLSFFQKMLGSSISEQIIYNSNIPVMVFHTHRTSDRIIDLP